MTMAEQIFALVDRQNHVTFAELSRLEGFSGDREVEMRPNCLLWTGVSEEAAQALLGLIKEQRVHFHPTTSLTYLIDGTMLRLPLARSVREYKKPHWLPVVINRGASPYRRRGGR
jgi:hypothetical protein